MMPVLALTEDPASVTHYRVIEVVTFSTVEGIELPASFKVTLTADVLAHLRKLKTMAAVSEGLVPEGVGPTLRLAGKVTKYSPGNRSLRYIAGPAVGATKITAHIVVMDRDTGQAIAEFDADGKVIMGPFGGDSMGASNGLAKEVAKKVKRRLF